MSSKLEERDKRIKGMEDVVKKEKFLKSEDMAEEYLDQLTKLVQQTTELEVECEKRKKKIKELETLVGRAEKQDEHLQQKTSELSKLELDFKQLKDENRKLQLQVQTTVPADPRPHSAEVKLKLPQEQAEPLVTDLRGSQTRMEGKQQDEQVLSQNLLVDEHHGQNPSEKPQTTVHGLPLGTAEWRSRSTSEDSITGSVKLAQLRHELEEKEKVIHNLQVQATTFQELARREEKVYDHSKHQSQEVLRLKKQIEVCHIYMYRKLVNFSTKIY